jgi:hypothetical protein
MMTFKHRVPSDSRKLREGVGRSCLLVLSLCMLVACRQDPLAAPSMQVKIGMARDEVISVLRPQTWYYQPCPNEGSIDDLFFFGSHSWDKASLLIVRSARDGQKYRVKDISSFDEANAWHTAFRECLQRNRFAP